jgi:hypothetical protein
MKKKIDCRKTVCRERLLNPRAFDRESFRMKRMGKGKYLVIACPKGYWKKRAKRCSVATRAQSIVRQLSHPKCSRCSIRR